MRVSRVRHLTSEHTFPFRAATAAHPIGGLDSVGGRAGEETAVDAAAAGLN